MQPSSRSPADLGSGWPASAWMAIIALAVLAAFQNGITAPFHLDDEISILENESIRTLVPISNVLWPRSDIHTAGRPLLNLSFALNYSLGGTSPRSYHVLNLLIHAAAAVTLFGIVRRTLLLPRFGQRFVRSASLPAALSALLWALHPLHTESVTYISQRAESLMGFCYLCTLYGLIRTSERPGHIWPVFTVACCLMGMMVKEVMATAPLILLLFDRTFIAGSFREAWQRRRWLYVSLAVTLIVLIVLMLASRIHARGVGFSFSFAWHEYFRIELTAVVHYLRLTLFPLGLVFDYGEEVAVPSAAAAAFCALLLGSLITATCVAFRRHSAFGFLGAWFFVILAPTSSVLPVAGQPIAENRMYLPLAALSVATAAGLYQVIRTRSLLVVLGLGLSFMVLTISRNREYQTALTLWADTVRKRPESARAWCYYANALLRAGRVDEAIVAFQSALRIRPAYSEAHINFAYALLSKQRPHDAIQHFLTALQIKPDDATAHSNLGTAYFQIGRKAEALQHYQHALRVRPDFTHARLNMGIVLAHLGRMPEAIASFEQVLRDDPNNQSAAAELREVRRLSEKQSPAAPAH